MPRKSTINKAASKKAAIASAAKHRSPFKDVAELEKEVINYIRMHRARIKSQASRISDYFEMCCFNYVVKFYEKNGYNVSVKNLQNGEYRYKCSTQGTHTNFSYFEVTFRQRKKIYCFQIYHNLAIQSSHEVEIFTTPDIAVIMPDTILLKDNFYEGNRRLSYVENKDLITFCEVKQFNPFPELLFNFIGTLNEIKKDIMCGEFEKVEPCHMAPTLMISGKPNKHGEKIKASLEGRYCLNILHDLFESGNARFSLAQINSIRKIEPVNLAFEQPF